MKTPSKNVSNVVVANAARSLEPQVTTQAPKYGAVQGALLYQSKKADTPRQ